MASLVGIRGEAPAIPDAAAAAVSVAPPDVQATSVVRDRLEISEGALPLSQLRLHGEQLAAHLPLRLHLRRRNT